MNRIIFVRHAETDMAGTFCGHSDPELNARGRAQLDNLIGKLKDEKFDKVFTSDLARARQTAQAIASYYDVELMERTGLREMFFGDWEGLTWDDIESRDPVLALNWMKQYPNLPAPAGETLRHFEERVQSEIDFLLHEAALFPIAVVTHAGFLRSALPRLRQTPEEAVFQLTKEYATVVLVDSFLSLVPSKLHNYLW